MSRIIRPTKYAGSITFRRLALAAAVSGAAIAATPALASAASTCTFTPDPLRPRVDVFDGSGSQRLDILRSGQFIAVSDFPNPPKLCSGPAGLATVTDTDLIAVHGTPSSAFDTYVINQSQGALAPGKALESDGVSEIETTIDTGGAPMQLHVAGTSGPDTMRVSAAGGVMLGSDADVDVRARSATKISLDGGPGNDFLSGRGGFPASFPGAATTKVTMFGGDGDDTGVDGPLSGDELQGNGGNDTLFSQDFQSFDHNFGGEGFDRATMDSGDFHSFNDIESITFAGVGRLKLAPAVVTGDAGKPARLKLAWKHPKAWKQLRSLKLTANDAGKAVGSIRIDPARANISAHGALEAARGSTVEHHGKSVIVQLRLRPSKQLAGRTLRLAVQATDVHGKRQIEPLAGSLTVNH